MDQSKQILRAGLVQMCSGRKIAENLVQADRLIRQAADLGARYVVTPENTALMELDPELAALGAQPYDHNSTLAMFQTLARELDICLQIGSLSIRVEGKKKLLNRSCLISPMGKIISWYDKIHLFDVDLPNGENYKESDSYDSGHRAVVTKLPVGISPAPTLGFSICYDLRFPHLFRALAKAGAQIITVPAAFTRQTGEAHWHVLLRARAIETGCYILAPAQGGIHENGRSTFGHSLIISPWGEIIAQAGEQPDILVADLDINRVEQARRHIPSLIHDRPFELIDMSRENNPKGET